MRNEHRIDGELSAGTRVELIIQGPIDREGMTRLKDWLRLVVIPWAVFNAGEEEVADGKDSRAGEAEASPAVEGRDPSLVGDSDYTLSETEREKGAGE